MKTYLRFVFIPHLLIFFGSTHLENGKYRDDNESSVTADFMFGNLNCKMLGSSRMNAITLCCPSFWVSKHTIQFMPSYRDWSCCDFSLSIWLRQSLLSFLTKGRSALWFNLISQGIQIKPRTLPERRFPVLNARSCVMNSLFATLSSHPTAVSYGRVPFS